jgi:hypothetical protein
MYPVDELEFRIALAEIDRLVALLSDAATFSLYIGERLVTVDLGLALAEQIQIGSVENVDNAAAHGDHPDRKIHTSKKTVSCSPWRWISKI